MSGTSGPVTTLLLGYSCSAAVAECGVGGILADRIALAPATLAFRGSGFRNTCGVSVAGFEFQFAEDEKLFQLGEAWLPACELGGIGELQCDCSFEVVGNNFFSPCFFQGLRDERAKLKQTIAFLQRRGIGVAF